MHPGARRPGASSGCCARAANGRAAAALPSSVMNSRRLMAMASPNTWDQTLTDQANTWKGGGYEVGAVQDSNRLLQPNLPTGDIRPLFNHLIGGEQELVWNSQSEPLCCLQIDNQLKSGGPLDWQIGGFRAF